MLKTDNCSAWKRKLADEGLLSKLHLLYNYYTFFMAPTVADVFASFESIFCGLIYFSILRRGAVEALASLWALANHQYGHLPSGYFMEPTVFTDVEDHMFIAKEESFGPVMVVSRFKDGYVIKKASCWSCCSAVIRF